MPNRNYMTEVCHPDPMTLEEFVGWLKDNENIDSFFNNMSQLKKGVNRKLLMEEWMETYLAWNEIFFDYSRE